MKNDKILNQIYLKNYFKINYALDYIYSVDFAKIKDGKINLNNGIYANFQTYMTKTDALFEAHRKYIDIQYMIKGNETIYIADYNNCISSIRYDNEQDVEFLTTNKFNTIEMSKGDFLILYPSDAHKPSILTHSVTEVRKLVIKIPIDIIE